MFIFNTDRKVGIYGQQESKKASAHKLSNSRVYSICVHTDNNSIMMVDTRQSRPATISGITKRSSLSTEVNIHRSCCPRPPAFSSDSARTCVSTRSPWSSRSSVTRWTRRTCYKTYTMSETKYTVSRIGTRKPS